MSHHLPRMADSKYADIHVPVVVGGYANLVMLLLICSATVTVLLEGTDTTQCRYMCGHEPVASPLL